MIISRENRERLNELFQTLKMTNKQGKDRDVKIYQVLAFLEIIHANIRKLSHKRELVFVECCAGNCYVSFLVAYYFTVIEERLLTIHCIDKNGKLMARAKERAGGLGLENMHFHTGDVLDFNISGRIDLVYSLHACDTATDGTLHLAVKNRAKIILSVSCCQHSIKKKLRNSRYSGITRHGVFKEKFVYMVGDSLRALLLEMNGYKADIFEFVSSRYTDKNIMIRARIANNSNRAELLKEYKKISNEFNVRPVLETYLHEK